MIEITLTGRCEGCPHFQMTIDHFDDSVGCTHEEVCDMWERKVKENGEEEKESY